jgi:lipopolysaccharide export system permease protein
MFIHQFSTEKNEEQIITAAQAEFCRNANGVVLILSNGSMETLPIDGSTIRTAHFDEYAMPIGMQGLGGLAQRGWRGVFELPLSEFFKQQPMSSLYPQLFNDWMSEAAKRFGIPLLALTHALLAIGLVLTLASASGRAFGGDNGDHAHNPGDPCRNSRFHRNAVRQDRRLVILVALAIVVEFVAAIILIQRQNANFVLAKETSEKAAR